MWDQDVKYFYYLHGHLDRTETGDNKVQGQDYAYTIQGWIKGVNSNNLKSNCDIGKDGNVPVFGLNSNAKIAKDEYGFSLGYFMNDYKAIGQTGNIPPLTTVSMFLANSTGSALEAYA